MFAKLSTVVALFAVAAQVAVAVPPACLIAAVNTQSDPSDIKSVCDGGASDVQKHLQSNCGDNLDAATSAFADVCKSAGVSVSSSSSTDSSASATGTKHASLSSATLTNGISLATGTASGFLTQTANATAYSAPTPSATNSSGSGSGSAASGSGSSQPTGTIVPSTGGAARLGMDIMGLAALGLAGFMLAL